MWGLKIAILVTALIFGKRLRNAGASNRKRVVIGALDRKDPGATTQEKQIGRLF